MKYIKDKYFGSYPDGYEATSFGDYFQYLRTNEEVKKYLPDHIYKFAIDESRYALQSPHSLHDSRINSIYFDHNNPDCLVLCLKLMGQNFDRIHTIKYIGINQFNLDTAKDQFHLNRIEDKFKGIDILYHEIRWEDGFIEHEILFDFDMKIMISCRDMSVEEEMI